MADRKNERDQERAEKSGADAGVLTDIDPGAYYNVSFSRPVKFRSNYLRPEQNPHLIVGDALRTMAEAESADVFSSVEPAGDGKDVRRQGADPSLPRQANNRD